MKVNRTDFTSSESFASSVLKMNSVIHKIKRKKSNARNFEITASVAQLKLECRKDQLWHPEKLVIYWNKDNTNCHTKPVPWQPGTNNPFRGIHVWPEPDPVTLTSKLYKNTKREGTYKDQPWNIVIKNESKSGGCLVIATGCIDVADYISHERKTFDITVTLKPANHNIISGSLEFTLTSVLLEDGIPYRNKEELLKEILLEAMKPTTRGTKTSKKLKHGKGTENIPLENSDTFPRLKQTVPALPSSGDKNLKQSNAEESSSQAGAMNKPDAATNNNGVPKQVTKKATPPPRPSRPPTHRKTTATDVPPALEVKEMKSSSTQSNGDEKAANSGANTSPSGRRKGKKKVAELGDGEEKTSYTDVPSPPARRKNRRKAKSKKYPIELNPFGGSGDENAATSSSKELGIKESFTTKVTDKADGEQKSSSEVGFSAEEAIPSKPENTDEAAVRDESLGPKDGDGALECDECPSSSKAVLSSCEDNSEREELAVSSLPPQTEMEDAVPCGTADTEKEKQKLACFFNKLLHPIPKVPCVKKEAPPTSPQPTLPSKNTSVPNQREVFQKCADLSAYVAEEMKLLQEELASLEQVIIKLELEISKTMKMKDCEEERDGLIQDWLSLNDYQHELSSRKRDLQILDKQEDFDMCCTIMRTELKLLFTLEDWRKTNALKCKEVKVLDCLLDFVNKSRENC